jgi:3-phenylpropionate/trans-cinnamate dioxygenase ferredoxin reductase component
MDTPARIAIVGAGAAGVAAARTLRTEGYDGEVVLLGDEGEAPYARPALSKAYLRAETTRDDIALLGVDGRRADHVARLDAAARILTLDSGERLGFDRLLLAPGAEARRLTVPGAGLAGVQYLRDLRDADALRARLAGAERVVVVGAGWLSAEVAASASVLGLDVTLLTGPRLPLEPRLGPELGAFFAEEHRARGVRVVSGPSLVELVGRDRLRAARLSDGTRLTCDVAVVAVGALPRVDLAVAAGLAVRRGVLADSRLRTSEPHIFVAGDVARALHPRYGRHLRVDHWAGALYQGTIAARNMLGADLPQRRLPDLTSELYGIAIEAHGLRGAGDRLVVRGELADARFVAFWLRAARVTAALAVGVRADAPALRRLLAADGRVDEWRLADPAVPLEAVTGS